MVFVLLRSFYYFQRVVTRHFIVNNIWQWRQRTVNNLFRHSNRFSLWSWFDWQSEWLANLSNWFIGLSFIVLIWCPCWWFVSIWFCHWVGWYVEGLIWLCIRMWLCPNHSFCYCRYFVSIADQNKQDKFQWFWTVCGIAFIWIALPWRSCSTKTRILVTIIYSTVFCCGICDG